MTAPTRRLSSARYVLLALLAIATAYVILAAVYFTLVPPACGCAATPLPS